MSDDKNRDQKPIEDPNDVDRLRREIEETRRDMGRTIDAIQDKASPERIKARVTQSVQRATRDKAVSALQKVSGLAKTASGVARGVAAKGKAVGSPNSDSVKEGTDQTPFAHRRTTAPASVGGGSLKPVPEQVVVVFGASSGIGRETAMEFGKRGAKVVVAARDQKGLDTLVEDIKYTNPNVVSIIADAADFESVQKVAARAVEEYGRLDTWVHVAAVSIYAKADETTPDEYRRVFDVNLMGTIHGALAAIPHLKTNGMGAFIAISSVEGMRSFPYQAAYSSSKHGIIGFLDALRVEIQHDGYPIAITNVMPAGINTPFFNKARTKLGVKPMPAPPIYAPSVVAEVILYAAEHPTRDITAGGAAQFLILSHKLAPGLTDKFVLRTGFESQKTGEPRDENAPDNLYEPIEESRLLHIGGDFYKNVKAKSLGNWLETHPAARRALIGGSALLFLMMVRRSGRR